MPANSQHWPNGLLPGAIVIPQDVQHSLLNKLEAQSIQSQEEEEDDWEDGDWLVKAVKNGDVKEVRWLLGQSQEIDTGAKDEENEWTAAQWAASEGHLEILRLLIPHLKQDQVAQTLLLAASQGKLESAKVILDAGFHPDCGTDQDGRSPLQVAIMKKQMEMCDLLLERGANCQHRCSEGKTSMHYAACQEKAAYMSMLMSRGAFVHSQDKMGRMPLHYAVTQSSIKATVMLIRMGGDLWHPDAFNQMPIDDIPSKTLEAYLNTCLSLEEKHDNEEPTAVIDFSVLNPSPTKPEWKRLRYFLLSENHKQMLTHPVLSTFVYLKWKRILPLFCFNFVAYFAYVICSSLYAVSFIPSLRSTTANASSGALTLEDHQPNDILHNVIKGFLCMLIGREAFQVLSNGPRYFTHLENYMEICIITLGSVAVFFDDVPMSVKRGCATLWPLFTWIELAFLIGRFPMFTKYIAMFSAVTRNYLIFLFPFAFIISGFVVSFYLTFNLCTDADAGCKVLYQNLPMAALKTVLMMMGEMDLEEMPYGALLPSTLTLVLLFIFLVMLVIMNLLNALAVSDTQKIADEAELYGLFPCVHLICYVESLFWKSTTSKTISNRMPKCCTPLFDNCIFRCIFKLLRKLPEHLLILPDMPGATITVSLSSKEDSSKSYPLPKHISDVIKTHVDEHMREEKDKQLKDYFYEMIGDVNSLEENMRKLNAEVQTDVVTIKDKVGSIETRLKNLQEQLELVLKALHVVPAKELESKG